jgi:hypothetical protein
MDTEPITNQNLMSIDFARKERIRFLQTIQPSKPPRTDYLAPGLAARGIWMNDTSAMDRRSVKAQLAGRGDYRVLWWHLNCILHHRLTSQATLEQMMFAFHQRHHRWTFVRLTLIRDFWAIKSIIQHQGICAGLRYAIEQMRVTREL